ncbi:MAG: hypothetical protein AAFQ63_09895 [Cyanobacteria bacterium J06621_11]
MKLIRKIAALSLLSVAITSVPAVVQAQTVVTPNPSNIDEPYIPETAYDEYMRLGFAAEQEENYVLAANYFRYALFAIPQDREAITAYWNARAQLQDDSELTGRAQVYNANMEAGYDATETGDYEAALAYFQVAFQQRPNDYYAGQAIRNVQTYISRGTQPDSSTDVAPTYQVYVNEPLYDRYMRLGYAAAQREDFYSAREYFRSALYDQPGDRTATVAYWNAVDAMQDGEFGLNETAETNYDRYMRRGYDATERGNYTQAMTFFERALMARPDDGYAAQAIRNVRTYMQ